jgi:hypothetical protein
MVVLLGYLKEDKLVLDAGELKFCPLSDNSGQRRILARYGLSAFDPKRTSVVSFRGTDA